MSDTFSIALFSPLLRTKTNIRMRCISEKLMQSNKACKINYLGLVDVVVGTGVRASDSHDNKVTALDEVVVDRRLEFVLVLLNPLAKVDGKCNHFCCIG